MKILTANGLQDRIMQAAVVLDCENIALAKQGKQSESVDEQLFEMMFIHEFLPYWNAGQIKQKECYLNDKYGI